MEFMDGGTTQLYTDRRPKNKVYTDFLTHLFDSCQIAQIWLKQSFILAELMVNYSYANLETRRR